MDTVFMTWFLPFDQFAGPDAGPARKLLPMNISIAMAETWHSKGEPQGLFVATLGQM